MNPSSPEDDFSLTYNCLQWADNNRTYNDGYHIQHHSNSRTHWSELPTVFMKQLALHDEKDGECVQPTSSFAPTAGQIELSCLLPSCS